MVSGTPGATRRAAFRYHGALNARSTPMPSIDTLLTFLGIAVPAEPCARP